MKKKQMFGLMITGLLAFTTTASIAASVTDINSNWICTTNASKADTEAGKAADDKLANTAASATDAFSAAAQNCRDCTKITCKVK
jgi:hypothetical protein